MHMLNFWKIKNIGRYEIYTFNNLPSKNIKKLKFFKIKNKLKFFQNFLKLIANLRFSVKKII